MESESMSQFRPLVKDLNSSSQIFTLLKQQIEKRKVFSQLNFQDYKYSFIINNISARFQKHTNMREELQKFIRQQIADQQAQNTELKEILS